MIQMTNKQMVERILWFRDASNSTETVKSSPKGFYVDMHGGRVYIHNNFDKLRRMFIQQYIFNKQRARNQRELDRKAKIRKDFVDSLTQEQRLVYDSIIEEYKNSFLDR